MEAKIQEYIKMLKNAYLEYENCFFNDGNLTAIQNKVNQTKSLENLRSNYGYFHKREPNIINEYSMRETLFEINPSNWYVNEFGIINNVTNEESNFDFPISIGIDISNVAVQIKPNEGIGTFISSFFIGINARRNSFLSLEKGSKYKIQGRIVNCCYIFQSTPGNNERFIIKVKGGFL